MTHKFADASISIFSNDLGCFDEHSLAQIRSSKTYDYFGGDSFTWGYANYQSKYATVYERESGRFTVKCGVTHTGQRHQFEKFRRISSKIGKFPRRVIVGYVPNDPANDYAHPHTTVMQGYQVDTVELISEGVLSKRNTAEMQKLFNDWSEGKMASVKSTSGPLAGIKAFLKKYSLTANLLNFVKQNSFLKNVYPGSFYGLNSLIYFDERFEQNLFTESNREAIKEWANHSKKNKYELIFVLIPVRENYKDVKYYSGVRKFLEKLNLSYVDLTEAFNQSGKSKSSIYWELDGHFNNEGNEFVGKYLASRLH
jgi:hypothetical protein